MFFETIGFQHAVQVLNGRDTKLFMRRICGALKIAFVEINHGRWGRYG